MNTTGPSDLRGCFHHQPGFKKPVYFKTQTGGFLCFIGFRVLLGFSLFFFCFNVQCWMLFTSNECVRENN